MQQPNELEMTNPTATLGLNAQPELRVALIFKEAPNQLCVQQIRDQLMGAVGNEQLQSTECNVARLSSPEVFSETAGAVAHADVIVAAVGESERIPAVFYRWVDVWLQQRAQRPGALVALVDRLEDFDSGPGMQDYLNTVAIQGGLKFIARECKDPSRLSGLSGLEQ